MKPVESQPVLTLDRLALFNPGRQSDSEIEASFIARRAVFDRIKEDVESTRLGGIPQHHLLVGQRGMGKTTMLHRIAVALRQPPARERFIPLTFPEEQWTMDRFSKFWFNCLDALADALEREQVLPELVDKIDLRIAEVRGQAVVEKLLAEDAERAFHECAAATGRLPVLLVDNLDLVFSRLTKAELHSLRASLMKAGSPVLIGACVSPPDIEYAAPFYDHFKAHLLGRLSLDEMEEVLLNLAQRTGQTALTERLRGERGRLQALHALTGGNPRTTVILFQIFARGFSEDAYKDLEALLDWMTPLYKARFEEFSTNSQVIVSALALAWRPITSGQVGELTRMENRTVSPLLDRLCREGVVEQTTIDQDDRTGPLPTGRTPQDRNGFQLAERFFNIWFLMRQATRRDKRNLTFLTRFLECMYTPAERAGMARDLMGRESLSRGACALGLALEPALESYPLRAGLRDHVHQSMIGAQRKLREEVGELLDPTEIPESHWAADELRKKICKLLPADLGEQIEAEADKVLVATALFPGVGKVLQSVGSAQDSSNLLNLCRGYFDAFAKLCEPEAAEWIARLVRHGVITSLAKVDDVAEALRRSDSPSRCRVVVNFADREALSALHPDVVEIVRKFVFLESEAEQESDRWFLWGNLLSIRFSRYSAAEESYRKAIALKPEDPEYWNNLGLLLHEELDRSPEAEASLNRAIELGPELADPYFNLGNVFLRYHQKPVEAERLYREALKREPEHSGAWANLGVALCEGKQDYPQAEESLRKAVALVPEFAMAWSNLGFLLGEKLARFAEAEKALRRAIALNPKDTRPWKHLARLLHFSLKKPSEALKAYRKIVQLDPKDASAWRKMADLLEEDPSTLGEAESALRTALEIAPKDGSTWNRLGNFLYDALHRPVDAEVAYRKALECQKEDDLCPRLNLAFLYLNHLARRADAEQLLVEASECGTDKKAPESAGLLRALCAAYDDNWGTSMEHLGGALDRLGEVGGFPENTVDDWMRASVVFVHLGFGDKLLGFLALRGDDQRLRPWYEALRALLRGDRRYLRNAPVEVRDSAGQLYDRMAGLLAHLPETTRRWTMPAAAARKSRAKRR